MPTLTVGQVIVLESTNTPTMKDKRVWEITAISEPMGGVQQVVEMERCEFQLSY